MLTEKQQRFVEAYCGPAKGNATEAARMAGYSGDEATLGVTGCRTLGNAKVASAIAEMNRAVRSSAIASAEEVQEFLTNVMRGTECRSPIVTMAGPLIDPATQEVMTEPPEAKDRVKAATELARIRGYVAPTKSEVKHEGGEVVVYIPENGRAR